MRHIVAIAVAMLALSSVAATVDRARFMTTHSAWPDRRLLAVGEHYERQGDLERAMLCYVMLCNRVRSLDNKQLAAVHARAFLKAGDIFYDRGNHAEALQYYTQGVKTSELLPGAPYGELLYKNIGNIYCTFDDYDKGYSSYKRALALAREHHNDSACYKIYQNMMGVDIYLNRVGEAYKLYKKTMAVPHERTPLTLYLDQYMLAMIMSGEGRHEAAIGKLLELSRYARSHLPPRYECSAYEDIYKNYLKMGNTDSALVYLDRCRVTARQHNIMHFFPEVLNQLSAIYRQRGATELALRLKDQYWQLRDSIYNQRKIDLLTNQHFAYEVGKFTQSLDSLRASQQRREMVISRQRTVIASVLFTVLVVTVLLLVLFRQNRRLKESYRSLYQLNKEQMLSYRQASLAPAPAAADDDGGDGDGPAPDVAAPVAKYRSSRLGDEQRERLASEISRVMENEDTYCNTDFSINTLATLVGSNSKYVSQVIHEVYGTSFNGYVNGYRVNLARERLTDVGHYGNYTIKAIGESLGFKSQTSFTNIFKRATGITPAMYQKIACEDAGAPR